MSLNKTGTGLGQTDTLVTERTLIYYSLASSSTFVCY